MEADLSYIHISSFLKVGPWCVYHIDVVHLTAWHYTKQTDIERISISGCHSLFEMDRGFFILLHCFHFWDIYWQTGLENTMLKKWREVYRCKREIGLFVEMITCGVIKSRQDGCFETVPAAADDHYLECCCFSPTVHSLLRPLVGCRLSSDPGNEKHRATGKTLSA